MKKQFATTLTALLFLPFFLSGYDVESTVAYDYFRGIPDGSYNGNSGVYFAANSNVCVCDITAIQLGGSFGIYNWDGRDNLVFKNDKNPLYQGFLTLGAASSFDSFNGGLVYDHMFTNHFGIYRLSPSIGQIRYQVGYQFNQDELGLWGTVRTNTSHKSALGIPVSFRAINQLNGFWSHNFCNGAFTSLWIGAPIGNSLIRHGSAGVLTAGFLARAPLTSSWALDAHGSYMLSKKSNSSRNYSASIAVGISYLFGCSNASYLPLVNNSLFLVDTNYNE